MLMASGGKGVGKHYAKLHEHYGPEGEEDSLGVPSVVPLFYDAKGVAGGMHVIVM